MINELLNNSRTFSTIQEVAARRPHRRRRRSRRHSEVSGIFGSNSVSQGINIHRINSSDWMNSSYTERRAPHRRQGPLSPLNNETHTTRNKRSSSTAS